MAKTIRYIGTEDRKDYWQCRVCRTIWLSGGSPEIEHVCKELEEGPGTELANMTEKLKLPSCGGCKQLMYKMNEWGPDLCRSNIDKIVDDIKTRTITPRYVIKKAVLQAISNYEKRVANVSSCKHTA